MSGLISQRTPWGLLLLRLGVGSLFAAHGAQKLFGAFGGAGLRAFASYLGAASPDGLGFPLPHVLAFLSSSVEFVGGLMVLIGFATEIAAALLVVDMLVAIAAVHWPRVFGDGGLEFPLALVLMSLALILCGPGRMALWDPFHRNRRFVR
jgi:putative oxidoreductase